MTKTRFSAALISALVFTSPASFADFLVIDKSLLKTAEALPASGGAQDEVVAGFGKGVKFGDLLQEVVPGDWFVSSANPILDQKVDWKGGVTWKVLVRTIARDNNWQMVTDDSQKIITISKKSAVLADASTGKADSTGKLKSGVKPASGEGLGYNPKPNPATASATNPDVAQAGQSTPVSSKPRHTYDVITGSLEDRVSVSLRGKTLKEVMHVLAPQGWQVDMQVPGYLVDTVIDYTAETTRKLALGEVLAPMGLLVLPYPNMSPAPLLVVVKGDK